MPVKQKTPLDNSDSILKDLLKKTPVPSSGMSIKKPKNISYNDFWKMVAERLSKNVGRPYSAQYVREVGTGYKSNMSIGEDLNKLILEIHQELKDNGQKIVKFFHRNNRNMN